MIDMMRKKYQGVRTSREKDQKFLEPQCDREMWSCGAWRRSAMGSVRTELPSIGDPYVSTNSKEGRVVGISCVPPPREVRTESAKSQPKETQKGWRRPDTDSSRFHGFGTSCLFVRLLVGRHLRGV